METRTKALIIAGTILALGTTVAVGASMANDGWRDGRGFEQYAGYGHHKGGHGWGRHGGGHGKRAVMMMLERFDADGDGKLTQSEIDQGLVEYMANFDSNQDKTLSLGEFEALWLDFMRERMVDRFQYLDADGDASVTLEEFQDPFSRMVESFDRNDDGKLGPDDRPRRSYDYDDDDEDEEDDD